ncbi:cytochrome P450 [Calocera viscosa TUFC12733]|uniref:Cytochrome P450 n=1 Tax=Calocera viscosa (strain TUFC12733) TaxID=1330018 RepID=A0A167PPU8_CALVF|nr:cytochrome P450 [Calocera viscosa TUFC12733]
MGYYFALFAATIATYVLYSYLHRGNTRLPPGPAGLPLIGNLLQVPMQLPFLKFGEWAKTYGPIYSFNILGQPWVVISNLDIAADILDRMSGQTGDRPRLIKANDFLERGRNLALMPKNDLWRVMRKATHESLNSRTFMKRLAIQEEEAALLVEGLLLSPEISLEHHVERAASSISMRTLYGAPSIPLKGPDPSARLNEIAVVLFDALVPGRSIVDIFPPLRHIIARSKWLRGPADKIYEESTEHFIKLFESQPSDGNRFISSALREGKATHGMSLDDSAWLVGMLFMAAQDTTAIAIRWLIMAFTLYPDVVKKAQAELDTTVGDRPPSSDDLPQLPYIEAIVKEVLRWRPPGPMGVPHATGEDIVYKDWIIPKGTILVSDIWTIGRDPVFRPNGDAFNPDRFLTDEGKVRQPPADTHDDYLAFGFGRRVCVGKDVAVRNLRICAAYLLWAFDFHKAKDENGQEIQPDDMHLIDVGVTVYPGPFKMKAVPRFLDLAERLQPSLPK